MHGAVRCENCIVFDPFCLDRSNECLWRGSELIKLRPKAFAVLNQLVERGEEVFGDRAREIAAEMAMHFERGGAYKRAAKYLQMAADNAIRRFAYQDAVILAQRGLEVLSRAPNDDQCGFVG
jgi:hypothetical protein